MFEVICAKWLDLIKFHVVFTLKIIESNHDFIVGFFTIEVTFAHSKKSNKLEVFHVED
jgi:hypothetical protein